MLAAYAEHLGTEVLVFRSPDAADAWLRARADGSVRPSAADGPEPPSAGD